jgi:hydrogenase/urease accessory protein HupE
MNRLMLLLLLALCLPAAARADVFHLGRYTLLPGDAGAGSHELLVDLPVDVETARAVTLPDGCRQTGESRQIAANGARFAFRFTCSRALVRTDVIVTPWLVDAASLRTPGSEAMAITPDASGVTLPIGVSSAAPRGVMALAGDYGWQGITHILTGWDHLCFVLCLCLLAQGRRLLLLVTLFTLGHSISLASAFFDWVSLPMPPVEAAIALSILFMAREALVPSGTGLTRQALVTSGFGLLHGLGFAAALGEMGVPAGERLPALLFFNLGVEAGLVVLAIAARIGSAAPLRTAALYATGIMSSVWLFERLAGFAVQAG